VIVADSDQQLPVGVEVNVADAALHVVETRQRLLLVLGDLDVAFFTDANRKLVASQRKCASLGRTAVANGFAALPAMVLPQSNLFLVIHRLQIPEEGSAAKLTSIRFGPVRRLESLRRHVPEHEVRVLADRHERLCVRHVRDAVDFVAVAVELKHGALSAGDVPDEDAGIVTAGEQPALFSFPRDGLDASVVALQNVNQVNAALFEPEDGDLTSVL